MNNDHQARIAQAIQHIRHNYSEPLRLAELAKSACFSPYHFHRIFLSYLGETPWEYLSRFRLEQSLLKMYSTSDPIGDIAMQVGYETPAAYTKMFKKHFGITPSRFREHHLEIVDHPSGPLMSLKSKIKEQRSHWKPKIDYVKKRNVLYVTHHGWQKGSFAQTVQQAFLHLNEVLQKYPTVQQQMCGYIGIVPDNIVGLEMPQARYQAGVWGNFQTTPSSELAHVLLEEGTYVTVKHEGKCTFLPQTWNAIYQDWFPSIQATLRNSPKYELFLGQTFPTPENEDGVQIHIPIKVDYLDHRQIR